MKLLPWLLFTITLRAEFLFATFHDPGSSGVYFELSEDGHQWQMLNDGKPWLPPSHPGDRDPKRMQAVQSKDLRHWSSADVKFPESSKHVRFLEITKKEAERLRSVKWFV